MIDSLRGQYRAGRIEATAQSKEARLHIYASGCSYGGTSTSHVLLRAREPVKACN
jgi:hypothetical protein